MERKNIHLQPLIFAALTAIMFFVPVTASTYLSDSSSLAAIFAGLISRPMESNILFVLLDFLLYSGYASLVAIPICYIGFVFTNNEKLLRYSFIGLLITILPAAFVFLGGFIFTSDYASNLNFLYYVYIVVYFLFAYFLIKEYNFYKPKKISIDNTKAQSSYLKTEPVINKPITETKVINTDKKKESNSSDKKFKPWEFLIGLVVVVGLIIYNKDYFKHYILPGKTYNINKKSEQSDKLVLNTFKNSGDNSIITLTWTNSSDNNDSIYVYTPGTNGCFYLYNLDEGRTYPVTMIDNIKLYPDYNVIQPGQSVSFTLKFLKTKPAKFNLLSCDNPSCFRFINVEVANWQ